MYEIALKIHGFSVDFLFGTNAFIDSHRQLNDILDGAIHEVRFQKAYFTFYGRYTQHRFLLKPVILNCIRLEISVSKECNYNTTDLIFYDLIKWVHVDAGATKKLYFKYQYDARLLFLNRN